MKKKKKKKKKSCLPLGLTRDDERLRKGGFKRLGCKSVGGV